MYMKCDVREIWLMYSLQPKWKTTSNLGGPLFSESNESMSHESMSQADFYTKNIHGLPLYK